MKYKESSNHNVKSISKAVRKIQVKQYCGAILSPEEIIEKVLIKFNLKRNVSYFQYISNFIDGH